jgi:putative transposase
MQAVTRVNAEQASKRLTQEPTRRVTGRAAADGTVRANEDHQTCRGNGDGKQATKPAAANFLQQQARFDKFIEVFNHERPHEALDMKCPAEVYQPSPRPYTGLPDIDYPFHDKTIVVTRCGRICLGNKKINFSQVFAGQAVGIKEVHDDIWLVSFMDYDLGYFDFETRVLEALENPFGPKVSPM